MDGARQFKSHTATCAGCGRRIPNIDEPAITWGVRAGDEEANPFCAACVVRLRVRVRIRAYPAPNPYRPRDPACCRCGVRLPLSDDGGSIFLVDGGAGRMVPICDDCRVLEGGRSRLAVSVRTSERRPADWRTLAPLGMSIVPKGPSDSARPPRDSDEAIEARLPQHPVSDSEWRRHRWLMEKLYPGWYSKGPFD